VRRSQAACPGCSGLVLVVLGYSRRLVATRFLAGCYLSGWRVAWLQGCLGGWLTSVLAGSLLETFVGGSPSLLTQPFAPPSSALSPKTNAIGTRIVFSHEHHAVCGSWRCWQKSCLCVGPLLFLARKRRHCFCAGGLGWGEGRASIYVEAGHLYSKRNGRFLFHPLGRGLRVRHGSENQFSSWGCLKLLVM
jgi:hypothetical protein